MNIGEKIKLRRKTLRWSQRELAEKMGYNHSTITRIEAGQIDIPLSKILQFADVLDTDISYLMGGDDEMLPAEDGCSKNVNSLVDVPKDAVNDMECNHVSNLHEIISNLCAEKGIKGAKMCSDLGISKGLLTDLKMGRRSGVSAVTAQKIASYFGVSVGYLLGKEEKEDKKEKPTEDDELSENMKMLIDFARSVPEDKLELVLKVMKSIVEVE